MPPAALRGSPEESRGGRGSYQRVLLLFTENFALPGSPTPSILKKQDQQEEGDVRSPWKWAGWGNVGRGAEGKPVHLGLCFGRWVPAGGESVVVSGLPQGRWVPFHDLAGLNRWSYGSRSEGNKGSNVRLSPTKSCRGHLQPLVLATPCRDLPLLTSRALTCPPVRGT